MNDICDLSIARELRFRKRLGRAAAGCALGVSLVVPAATPVADDAAPATAPATAEDAGTQLPSEVIRLRQLSLEELINEPLEASGTLVPTTLLKSPSAITIITAEDIRLTPHRNLLDLIEVYVPGAMVLTHSDGLKLGLRGIVSDRNVKFLLLVNGRQINQRGHSGAAAELANWDLSDVERIEVIRGPGSVTYGPGAIAGVVNIITKTGQQVKGGVVNVKYVSEYDTKVGATSLGWTTPWLDAFVHLSLAGTPGAEGARMFTMENAQTSRYGFLGTGDYPAGNLRANPPLEYLRDFEDLPQYKAMLDLRFLEEWRLWARYTSSGYTTDYRDGQARYQVGFDGAGNPRFGSLESFKQIRIRDVTISLDNRHEFTDWFALDTAVEGSSQDFERRFYAPYTYPASTPVELQQILSDPGGVRYTPQNFAEDDWWFQELARFEPVEKVHVVLGAEYLITHYGPGWGDDPRDFRMGEASPVGNNIANIINGPDSHAINPPGVSATAYRGLTTANAVMVGDDGWTTGTSSLLGEVSVERWPLCNILVSGRLDKHRDTGWLFSPRLSLVSELNKRNYLKLQLQQSVRMSTGEQLLLAHVAGKQSDPEVMRGIELTYETLPLERLSCSLSGFLYDLDVIGWNGMATSSLGRQQHWGLEFETEYKTPDLRLGLNHSFIQLLDWDLAGGITGTGVSFADYNEAGGLLQGTGRDLNNWANNATKVYLDYRFLKPWVFHADARAFWGFAGGKDQLRMIERAAASTSDPADDAVVAAAVSELRHQGVWDLDFRLNLSLTYEASDWFSVTVYAQNLVGTGSNKRYDYDTGTRNLSPRAYFVEEPRVFGVMARIAF